MKAERTAENVTVRMTHLEGFVLSNLLFRWQQDGTIDAEERYGDPAVRLVLLHITGSLDYVIDEGLSPDCQPIAEKARESLIEPVQVS